MSPKVVKRPEYVVDFEFEICDKRRGDPSPMSNPC